MAIYCICHVSITRLRASHLSTYCPGIYSCVGVDVTPAPQVKKLQLREAGYECQGHAEQGCEHTSFVCQSPGTDFFRPNPVCPPAGLVFHLLLLNTLCRLKAGNTLSAGRPRGLCPTGMKE